MTAIKAEVPDANADAAVIVRGLGRSFGDHNVLQGMNLDIGAGEFVALLGASGSGKTTLLRTLAGLEPVEHGTVLVPSACTVVFQEPRLVPSKRAWRNVVLGWPRSSATRAAAHSALQEVGLSQQATAWPATLSGGEAQRVALARALVRQPQLLLLDEPFAALDALTRLKMQDLITELCRRHQPAVLLVTHDINEAIILADRVCVLKDGKITLDIGVDLARPRAQAGARFDALHARLLAELGVGEPLKTPPASPG